MQRTNGFPSGLFALFLLTLTGVGCASANPPQPTVPSTAAVATVPTRGGVVYDPSAPLNPTLTPKFDEKNPPPQALPYALKYTSANGQVVTGLYVAPTPAVQNKTRVPCILVLHGLGGRKEDVALISLGLAGKGFASLAIDIAGHGERLKPGGKTVGQLNLEEIRQLVGQTLCDLHKAVDYVQTRAEVDATHLGFVGVSLGGIVGSVFVGDEPRIKSTVLWSAGGDWGRLVEGSTHPLAKQFRESNRLDGATINKTMSDVDPLNNIGQRAACPLLFINGDKDTVVPNPCIDALYNAIKEPRKRLVLPGGHIPDGLAMLTRTIVFFKETLTATAPGTTATATTPAR